MKLLAVFIVSFQLVIVCIIIFLYKVIQRNACFFLVKAGYFFRNHKIVVKLFRNKMYRNVYSAEKSFGSINEFAFFYLAVC